MYSGKIAVPPGGGGIRIIIKIIIKINNELIIITLFAMLHVLRRK
jgi:hypothetical protein